MGQNDPAGCGAACLAMIVGCTYVAAREEIDAMLWVHGDEPDPRPKPVNWLEGGITQYHLDRALYAHGFFKQTRYSSWGWDLSVPFAPIHWAIVRQPSNNHHFVVMLEDGDVLDPLRDGRYNLSDWEVLQVCGLCKL